MSPESYRSSSKSSQSSVSSLSSFKSAKRPINVVMSPTSSQSSISDTNSECEQFIQSVFETECDIPDVIVNYYDFDKKRCQQLIKHIRTCDNMFVIHHFVKIMTSSNEYLYNIMCDLTLEYFSSGKFDGKLVKSIVEKPNKIDTDNIQKYMNTLYQSIKFNDLKKYRQSIEEYNTLLTETEDYSMLDFLTAELEDGE